jgi:ABC-type Zn uptake system ZnuABC Zn-binding protein ZnuA
MQRTLFPSLIFLALLAPQMEAVEPLRICCSVPDLGDIAKAVGGEAVEVTTFARGGDDPHFVEPRPGFAKALSRADLVVSVGLELEIGWLPVVVTQARNPRLASGQPGWFEAASAITVLGLPNGVIDRSHGDVHPGGNPHFFCDPVCGVQVAKALARRMGELRPESATVFVGNYRVFALEVARHLVGAAAVTRAGEVVTIDSLEQDALSRLIGDGKDLGGWLGLLRPAAGARLIADHDLWPYFSRRFSLTVVGFLEPRPGVPPTTSHLTEVIKLAKETGVRAIITVPYFDPRSAAFVAKETGLPVVALAHQPGSITEAQGWLGMIDYNVHALATALGSAK